MMENFRDTRVVGENIFKRRKKYNNARNTISFRFKKRKYSIKYVDMLEGKGDVIKTKEVEFTDLGGKNDIDEKWLEMCKNFIESIGHTYISAELKLEKVYSCSMLKEEIVNSAKSFVSEVERNEY